MYRPAQTIECAQEELIVSCIAFRDDAVEMIVGNYLHRARYLDGLIGPTEKEFYHERHESSRDGCELSETTLPRGRT